MSIDKLKRVIWRLNERFPNQNRVLLKELERAIFYECGTDPETVRNNKKVLVKLGWVSTSGHWIMINRSAVET